MKKRAMKKWISSLLVLVLCFGILPSFSVGNGVSAKTKTESTANYVTGRKFVKYLVKKLGLEVKKGKNPYLNAAYREGIYEPTDIKNLDLPITIAEISVLLNRADEYLHGDTLEESYVKMILDKRISDISTIDREKREAVAKVYGKGIIKGYSDGMGVKSRSFRGDTPVSVKAAKAWVYYMMNPEKRAKLSPDGLLIRTTNLPKNAENYEYILECFPNEFYEKKFEHEYITRSTSPILEGRDYIFPVNMHKDAKYKNDLATYTVGDLMDKELYDWAELVEEYTYLLFNVDYRTIGKDWRDAMSAVSKINDQTEAHYDGYIRQMKDYNVIVETRKVAVEPSTFHYSCGWKMRVYVEYKISANRLTEYVGPYLYVIGGIIDGLKLDTWMTGYFDISLGSIDDFWNDTYTFRPKRSDILGW